MENICAAKVISCGSRNARVVPSRPANRTILIIGPVQTSQAGGVVVVVVHYKMKLLAQTFARCVGTLDAGIAHRLTEMPEVRLGSITDVEEQYHIVHSSHTLVFQQIYLLSIWISCKADCKAPPPSNA